MSEKMRFWAGVIVTRWLIFRHISGPTACYRAGLLCGTSGCELWRRKRWLWNKAMMMPRWEANGFAEQFILGANGEKMYFMRLDTDDMEEIGGE